MIVTAQNFEQCRAAYGDEYLILHGVARLVTCEHCNGLATIAVSVPCSKWADPADACGEEPCPECEGDGRVCVFVEAVECDDDAEGQSGRDMDQDSAPENSGLTQANVQSTLIRQLRAR